MVISKIPSDTGKFKCVVFDKRICTLFTRGSIEDKFYYLFQRDTLTTKRNLYIKALFLEEIPIFQRMEQLFQTKSKEKLEKLRLFCENLRNAFLS